MILTFGTTPAVQRVMEFERLTVDDVNRAKRVTELTAGKAMNAARVARTLGAQVTAISFLGGATGELIKRDMARLGVIIDAMDVPLPTRTCVTLLDHSAGTTTELVEESAAVEADAYHHILAALDRHLPNAKVLICSGTLTPGAPDNLYATAVRKASAAGVQTIIDAKGSPLHHALAQHPTVVKPNLSELSATVGRPLTSEHDLRQAMTELCARGAGWVVVSRGARPVVITNGSEFWTVEIPKVAPLNPIGSGDCLAAGIAVELSRGTALPDAALLGVAAAVSNAMTMFAGFIEMNDVERFGKQLTIQHA